MITIGSQICFSYDIEIDEDFSSSIIQNSTLDITVGHGLIVQKIEDVLCTMDLHESRVIFVDPIEDDAEDLADKMGITLSKKMKFTVKLLSIIRPPNSLAEWSIFFKLCTVCSTKLSFHTQTKLRSIVVSKTFDVVNAKRIGQEHCLLKAATDRVKSDSDPEEFHHRCQSRIADTMDVGISREPKTIANYISPVGIHYLIPLFSARHTINIQDFLNIAVETGARNFVILGEVDCHSHLMEPVTKKIFYPEGELDVDVQSIVINNLSGSVISVIVLEKNIDVSSVNVDRKQIFEIKLIMLNHWEEGIAPLSKHWDIFFENYWRY
jgi:hypothetical protein